MVPEVIYENEYVVAVNKPSGLVVHSDGRTEEKTLSDWLISKYPDIKNVGEPWERDDGFVIHRPGIVHRLDRETSGALVVARTQEAFLHLKKQFQERAVEKMYNVFVYGTLKEQTGSIDLSIGRSASDFRKKSAQHGAKGELRNALTLYKVLKQNSEASYLEVFPKTGRTHQIRVHFKALHHPVVCDKLYAQGQKCILGFDRLALHARKLSFTLPDKSRITVEAPIPTDFEFAHAELS